MRHASRFVLCALLASCGQAQQPLTAASAASQPIIGGTYISGSPSVVMLVAENGSSAYYCTATAIASRALLTAAHCVDPWYVGNGASFSVFLGHDASDQAALNNAANWIDVTGVVAHPSFNPNAITSGHDIAVVHTAQALPVAAMSLRRTALEEGLVGTELRLVGYGKVDAVNDVGLRKSEVRVPIGGIDARFVWIEDPSHTLCNGDSGGPSLLMVNGVEVVVGVHSFGSSGCASEAFDARVDIDVPFIDAQLNAPTTGTDAGTADSGSTAGDGGAGSVRPIIVDDERNYGPPASEDASGCAQAPPVMWALAALGFALLRRRR